MTDMAAAVQVMLEFERANPRLKTRTCERRTLLDGKWLWSGDLYGFHLDLLTNDPDMRCELEPIQGSKWYGAQMVDQTGRQLVHQIYHY